MLKQSLELSPQPLRLARRLIGVLDLSQNLRLTQHHGIETYRHTHQVSGGIPIQIMVGAVQQLFSG